MPASDWRADPNWQLVEWATNFWPSKPEDKPVPQAELCGGGAWASVFIGTRAVATWNRYLPVPRGVPEREPTVA